MKKLLFALWAVTLISAFNFASADYEQCLDGDPNCSTETDVTVTIEGGDICIWSPEAFDFGTHVLSDSSQIVTWQFASGSERWYVDDQKGADTGYYTTVQVSDMVDPLTSNSIAASNVSMQSNWTSAISDAWEHVLAGFTNTRVYTNPSLLSSFVAINAPVEFINRDADSNSWIVGKYYDLPYLELVIPAYTPVGTYEGIITYTLYEGGH